MDNRGIVYSRPKPDGVVNKDLPKKKKRKTSRFLKSKATLSKTDLMYQNRTGRFS